MHDHRGRQRTLQSEQLPAQIDQFACGIQLAIEPAAFKARAGTRHGPRQCGCFKYLKDFVFGQSLPPDSDLVERPRKLALSGTVVTTEPIRRHELRRRLGVIVQDFGSDLAAVNVQADPRGFGAHGALALGAFVDRRDVMPLVRAQRSPAAADSDRVRRVAFAQPQFQLAAGRPQPDALAILRRSRVIGVVDCGEQRSIGMLGIGAEPHAERERPVLFQLDLRLRIDLSRIAGAPRDAGLRAVLAANEEVGVMRILRDSQGRQGVRVRLEPCCANLVRSFQLLDTGAQVGDLGPLPGSRGRDHGHRVRYAARLSQFRDVVKEREQLVIVCL